jgi:hypothetical protein
MKQITMREVQLHLASYVTQLPVSITRFGKVIAILKSPDDVTVTPELKPKKVTVTPDPIVVEEKPITYIPTTKPRPFISFSKQSQVKGFYK